MYQFAWPPLVMSYRLNDTDLLQHGSAGWESTSAVSQDWLLLRPLLGLQRAALSRRCVAPSASTSLPSSHDDSTLLDKAPLELGSPQRSSLQLHELLTQSRPEVLGIRIRTRDLGDEEVIQTQLLQ